MEKIFKVTADKIRFFEIKEANLSWSSQKHYKNKNKRIGLYTNSKN